MNIKDLSKFIDINIIQDGSFSNLIKLDDLLYESNNLAFVENYSLKEEIINKLNISVIICESRFISYYKELDIGIIEAVSPKNTFFDIINCLNSHTDFYGKKTKSVISDKAKIAPNVVIDPIGVIIEDNVTIKSGSIINSGSRIMKNTYIGENCTIGGESFAYYGANKQRVISGKGVFISENTEILGMTHIARGVYRDTFIGTNTKIGSQAHIAHDCYIDSNNMIGAMACIAGKVIMNKNCYIGPGSVIKNNIRLAEKTIVSLGSVVINSTKKAGRISGNFAMEHEKFLLNFIRKQQ